MPTLLGRSLTHEEQVVEKALRAALEERRKSHDTNAGLLETTCDMSEQLCAAAVSVLESDLEAPLRRWLYMQLIGRPGWLRELVSRRQFSRQQLLGVCRYLISIDNFFDVRLAELLPRPYYERSDLDAQGLLRVLDVLNEISQGSRLILSLNHLTHHSDQRVASKATLIVGRRLQNKQWAVRQMESSDPRVRASVMESLWGISTELGRELLRLGLRDENNRVVGNAILGLHRLGAPEAAPLARQMLKDDRPSFRWTAAWVIGRMGDKDFVADLEKLLRDTEPHVRLHAKRALRAIRKAAAGSDAPAETQAHAEEEAPLIPVETELQNDDLQSKEPPGEELLSDELQSEASS